MTLNPNPDVPAQGQLVEVRNRRFIVNEVSQSAQQHLVTLTSVDDEGLGEALQVIWELEPGAQMYDQSGLPTPTGFDPPRQLDSFLNAVRWGAIAATNDRTLQAPFRSGIEIEDYQLDPLVRALQMPRVNLLIADDVGLGKTIEAGLVMQEMILRNRVQQILIVCPAALQIHWQEQMRDKFGLTFRIINSSQMKELRRRRGIHVNPWIHFPRLITSIDFLKRERPLRLYREVLPAEGEITYPRRFDMLVLDEAHNVAPTGAGHYATDSDRTRAIRLLTPHFEHRLFLTATPHNGYLQSFSALLELLDNQRFARDIAPDPERLASVMVRRLKSDLPPAWDGSPRFQPRHIEPLPVAYVEAERQAYSQLQRYTLLRRQQSKDSTERTATDFVLKLLKKRLFSSPAAFALTLEKHIETVTEGRSIPEPSNRFSRPSAGVLRRFVDDIENEYTDDSAYEQMEEETLSTSGLIFQPLSEVEKTLLHKMRSWAEQASRRPDSKALTLIDWLQHHICPEGVWSGERVIIFTEYRDTQKWLQGLLVAAGLAQNGQLLVLHGGMSEEERERVKAAFQAEPDIAPVRILLATDAASEGIDLQRHCHRLIHYEIPWNPNRMEQRNGRIDRHGQQRPPLIYHFVPSEIALDQPDADVPVGALAGDLEFLMRAVYKVEQIREDLGRVGPVIAEQVTAAMLGDRSRLETADAEQAAEPARRLLRFQRKVDERIQRLHKQLRETVSKLDLTPHNVKTVVEIALKLAGQPPLVPVTAPGENGATQTFDLPALSGAWATCSEGLAHPHTTEIRPIVFDHDLARGRDDVVLAHLNHRLVQMSLQLLRAEVWRQDAAHGLHRVTARIVPDRMLETPAVIVHARLLMIGKDNHRLHEEVIATGGLIREGRFRRMNVSKVQEVLTVATERRPSQGVHGQLQAVWPLIADSLLQALDARASERSTSLRQQLERQAQKEVTDMTTILQELSQQIRQELDEPATEQLELFSSPEQEQYNRNRSALRARLEQIPSEIKQEDAAIRTRYAGPQSRRFPVAVTFLVPERLAV